MTYLILTEERTLPYDLEEQLAQIMAESPDLVLADATYRLRNSHGILEVPDRGEAERLSGRFAALGVPTFLLNSLLHVPEPEALHLMQPPSEGPIGIAALAALRLTTEREEGPNLLDMQLSYPPLAFPVPQMQEETYEEHVTRYCLDLSTREQHWRGEPDALALAERLLNEVDLSGAYLGAGVRSLQAGERHFPRFTREQDHERYLKWLYQLKYAYSNN